MKAGLVTRARADELEEVLFDDMRAATAAEGFLDEALALLPAGRARDLVVEAREFVRRVSDPDVSDLEVDLDPRDAPDPERGTED